MLKKRPDACRRYPPAAAIRQSLDRIGVSGRTAEAAMNPLRTRAASALRGTTTGNV